MDFNPVYGLEERRLHVPWMNFDEWKQVYEDLYSNNIELQRRAYEMLLLWKARQSSLPAGLDCTLGLIHVHIVDQDVSQQISKGMRPTYAVQDMQLMCSTAVMRFLNHVSNVVRTPQDSLLSMAKKLNIPSWMVELRHTSAHSSDLPSLTVLRMAVKFAIGWLQENYWKETAEMPDWVISKTDAFGDKRVEELLDVWQALKMYEMNGYQQIDEINEGEIRSFIVKFLNQKVQENRTISAEDGNDLLYITGRVRKDLFRLIRRHSKQSVLEKLITLVLESESFIPPKHLMNIVKKDTQGEPTLKWLCKFWESLLVPLQELYALFPNLVHKLLVLLNEEKCEHRQLIISLWIKQLCISIVKSQALIHKVDQKSENQDNFYIKQPNVRRVYKKKKLKPRIQKPSEELAEEFEMKNKHLQDGFFAVPKHTKGNSCPIADVKLALLNPNKFTSLFLPSLLSIAKPSISEDLQCQLQKILCIYINSDDLDPKISTEAVHTVQDLDEESSDSVSKSELHHENAKLFSAWDFASEYDWATCPLGILPWQKNTSVSLEIPSHVSWNLPTSMESGMPGNFQHPVHQKIDWHQITKERSSIKTKLKKRKLAKRSSQVL